MSKSKKSADVEVRDWNPVYVAYAESQGRTPAAQLALDKQKPGKMVDFIIWVSQNRKSR